MRKKHNCARCIHFNEKYYYAKNQPYDSRVAHDQRVVWVKNSERMGGCMKRLKSVNKIGFPCKFYELPESWWKRIIRKLVKQ